MNIFELVNEISRSLKLYTASIIYRQIKCDFIRRIVKTD